MAPKQYVREDRRIRIALDGGRFTIEDISVGENRPELRWSQQIDESTLGQLVGQHDAAVLAGLTSSSFAAPDATISRLVVEVPQKLAWGDWESILASVTADRVVVRSVASLPSYAGHPVVVPLRFLHLTYGHPTVEEWVNRAVGFARNRHLNVTAELAGAAHLSEAPTILRQWNWPVADVIHVTEPYRSDRSQEWFDTLERLVRIAQCRLLVLEPTNAAERPRLLSTADRIARRGGPAVVVPTVDDAALADFYADILHDKPLDAATTGLGRACLYAGQGREDALRISTAGAELYHAFVVLRDSAPPPSAAAAVEQFAAQWHDFEFVDSERRGLYPMTEMVHRIRDSYPPPAPAPDPVERHVEPALYEGDRPVPTAPRRPLRRGARYELRIDVTTDPGQTDVALAHPLLFEHRLWDETDGGIWLDVGVTGIGWEVLDEAEQRLFVPKTEPSAPCWFAVRPTETGAPVLRFTLFHNGHIIQSYRLAAVVADGDRVNPTVADGALAEVLMLGTDDVRDRTWRARLEFSTVATIEQSRERPPRALAIVANNIAGRPTLTFKTVGEFQVHHPQRDIDDYVGAGRALLEDLTFNKETKNYLLGIADGDPNAATDEMFAADLPRLAKYGADLYDALVPLETRQALRRLGPSPVTIQVASILRDKVIPWALIYQGKYDKGPVEDEDGNAADHDVCTALLDNADPQPFANDCGELPACLLHPATREARAAQGVPPLLEKTVACPGRFWGFRHRVELPPAQVPPDGTGTAAIDVINAGPDSAAVLAVSPDLSKTQLHGSELRELVRKDRGWRVYEPTRKAALISALGRDNLAVVYVLSRAKGGVDGPLPPELNYFDTNQRRLIEVTPQLLDDVIWLRHPIVVLNGCGTAGFSPKAISQFITAFIDDRRAAAVLGTEASVSDLLASEFGHLFLSAFLRGNSAGDALLAARRSLLVRRNPLGLSYSLYGVSELHIAT